ncbi:6163_t:CDS:2, partial [Rhizophagus irregularis]
MREKHKLSGYFLILEEKSNKYNNYVVCQDCIRVLGREAAMKQKFTNTKRACAKHLENCPHWAERHTPEQTLEIIQKAMDYGSKKPYKRQRIVESEVEENLQLKSPSITPSSHGSSNLNNFFYKTSRTNSISSSISEISFQSFGPLDNYAYREKVLGLAQIRAHMQKQQQIRELDFHAKQYKTIIENTSYNTNLESNDDMFVLSDDEDTNIDNETNERDIYTRPLTSINEWRNMVTHWVEMIENELQEDQDNEVASIVDTYDISIDNIEQLQHPAVDLQAKWELKNIFVENLELPNYLEDFII